MPRTYDTVKKTLFADDDLGTGIKGGTLRQQLTALWAAYAALKASAGQGGTQPTALGIPANLRQTASTSSSVTFSWDAVANATGYRLRVNGSTLYMPTTTSYTLTGLTAGSSVSAEVQALGDGITYATGSYSATAPGKAEAAAKPKKLVFIGDSLVNSVLTTTSRATARLGSSSLVTAVISHPGESVNDYLNNHVAETAAAVDSTKDCYAVVSLGTNDVNQFYLDTLKQQASNFADLLLNQGYKDIVWMQVGACQSPYAYARDSNGAIIGSNTADQQAGYDNARKAYNAYLQTLVGSKLYKVGELSVYPNVYTQTSASDTRYFYAAGQGAYGNSEPGRVHFTDYGARYWAEACAQAVAPMLGITLSPATVNIPDAPISAGQTLTQLTWKSLNGNTTTASNGSSVSHPGTGGWDGDAVANKRIPLPLQGEEVIVTFPGVSIPSDGPSLMVALSNTVQPSGYTYLDYAQYFDYGQSITFLKGTNTDNGGPTSTGGSGSAAFAPNYGDIECRITRTSLAFRHKASGTRLGNVTVTSGTLPFPLEIVGTFSGPGSLAAPTVLATNLEPSAY